MSIHYQPSATACVQKYLGSSYDTVKLVADNLDSLIEMASVLDISSVLAEVNTALAAIEEAIALSDIRITAKQNTLVSGTNIKTINGVSVLGSGNLNINIASPVTPAHVQEVSDSMEQLILMGI